MIMVSENDLFLSKTFLITTRPSKFGGFFLVKISLRKRLKYVFLPELIKSTKF